MYGEMHEGKSPETMICRQMKEGAAHSLLMRNFLFHPANVPVT